MMRGRRLTAFSAHDAFYRAKIFAVPLSWILCRVPVFANFWDALSFDIF